MNIKKQKSKRQPLKYASIYMVVGLVWFFFADVFIDALSYEGTYISQSQLKGILFIAVTAVVFYMIMHRFDSNTSRIIQERTELLQKNYRLSAIANNLHTGVVILDPHQADHPVIYVNHGFTELTGYSFEEAVGQRCWMLCGEGTDPGAISTVDDALKSHRTVTVELVNYRKDGRWFWNEVHIHPIYDKKDRLIFFLVLQNDVSARKEAERKLKDREQRYKSLFENNPAIVCSCDRNGRITELNPVVEQISGYRVEELMGRNILDFIKKEERKNVTARFRRVPKGIPQQDTIQVKHKEGHFIDLEVAAMPIRIDGEIVGVYMIAKDVTEYNKAQEMLRRAEKLNVAGELAAGIAHEIRNPLTSLKGFVQLLQPTLTDKKAYTDVMLSELERINQIVTELLLLAKPQTAAFEEKHLQQLLEHVRTLMNTKAIMNYTEIVIDYRADTTNIYCEENQLKQVFINVLKNAIEAMPDGGEIKIAVEDTDDGGVLIRVIDEGDGIPEESLPKLGEPFYTTKEQGTGLGLMISSKIIEEHGGTMGFVSDRDEGTTVEILLPSSPKEPESTDQRLDVRRS